MGDFSKYTKREDKSFLTQTKNHRAFTLMQLLIVVGIIAVVSGIAVVPIQSALTKAKLDKVEIEIEMLGRAVEQIEEDPDNFCFVVLLPPLRSPNSNCDTV